MRAFAIATIRAYKFLLSPIFAGSCRFYPSCSQYAIDTIAKHGTLKGIMLAARRLSKCHPFHPGGYDPA